MSSSIPAISEFIPLPFQLKIIRDIRRRFDYDLGVHEVLLSGSVGSAKTILLAHLAITHAVLFPGSVVGIGRRTLPSLKETLLDVVIKHLSNDLVYQWDKVKSIITFQNGSKIKGLSWADGNYKKFRSYEFSAFFVEELTENDDLEFYDELLMRVGRLSHVPEKLIVCATNPDDPEHPAYKHFITSEAITRHTYYSVTADNPYLPDSYLKQLSENMDPKMARRMLFGEWLSINQENIYYAYEKEHNFKKQKYTVLENQPIHWSWDFNIGIGKPLSTCFFQHVNSTFHVFEETVIHGSRTEDALEDALNRGLLDYPVEYVINGDATGKHKDTRSKHSDYEIIHNFLSRNKNRKGQQIKFKLDVPLVNPKIRDRHNIVNAQLHNNVGQRRLLVYETAPTVDEGLRLTKLKPGASYIEDDSKEFQHITTSLGYGVVAALRKQDTKPIGVIRR